MTRGIAPIVGTILLVAITVILSAIVGLVATDVSPAESPDQLVVLDVSVTADDNRLTFVHKSGPSLDVRVLTIMIEVDGRPLKHQPPIPFFSAKGFRSGPSGPFNSATDPTWRSGERATLQLAGTNTPGITEGVKINVRISESDRVIADLNVRAK